MVRKLAFIFLLVVTQIKAHAESLFYDGFDGSALDASKWSIVTPFQNSSFSVQDGYLSSLNRGIAVTQQEFSSGYTVSGSFSLNSLYDIFNIVLRSNGQIQTTPDLVEYGVVGGVTVGFWGGQGGGATSIGLVWADEYGSINEGHLWNYDLAIGEQTIRTFSIYDSGSAITVSVDSQELFSVTTAFALGGKVALFGTNSGPNVDPGKVNIYQLEIVPEPSALSLLAVGLGGLAILRRRRS